ncbi:MAG: hypothetical protein GY943_13635 [Chloroflexi bacterium]|nr:hypothetical protein [Chloroflexota bacterium]
MAEVETNKPQRVLDLESGIAMVVTDLHGDWNAYERYRNQFLTLKGQGKADTLILLGDLIHRSGPAETDASLDIILDVLKLQKTHGDAIICVLGNHELPHIYSILLQKGNEIYTPRFEEAMGEHRQQILDYFDSLPFYIRTKAGVALCHAGATAAISQRDGLARLWHFSHQQVLEEAKASISTKERPSLMRSIRKMYGRSYNEMTRSFFAVQGLNDPRYDDFLIGTIASSSSPDFDLLWAAMFTRNEQEYGDHGYSVILNTMLKALSRNYHPQIALVTGHIDCRGGYKLISNHQLRLASAKHAQPRESGQYLLFDMGESIKKAEQLIPKLQSVFR